MAVKVLLIDDEVAVLNSLKRVFRREPYEIFTADSGPEALQILGDIDVAVIVCDYQMVGMTGAEVLAESVKLRPDAVRITLTGNADLKTALSSINEGRISHFLLKPWNDDHLRAVVRESARHYEMEQEIRHLHELTRRQRDELEVWNRRLEEKVRERTAALHAAYEETLGALVLALDSREHATAGHSRRVAAYCLYLALEVGIPSEKLKDLYRGALLHDIGKIGVPDAVLLKPGKLNPDEREIIEQHVDIGGRFLEGIGYLKQAVPIPLYHHERYDGTGYSEGLTGESIPIEARVFAVVDVYDALRSKRPYKEPMPHPEACEVIAKESGTHFDPAITATFLAIPCSKWEALADSAASAEDFRDALSACESIRATACLAEEWQHPAPVMAEETR